jgi:hypothetical protein
MVAKPTNLQKSETLHRFGTNIVAFHNKCCSVDVQMQHRFEINAAPFEYFWRSKNLMFVLHKEIKR